MVQVVMPQMGESLAEGTVVRWLKKPGDRVARDEPLFEISTDKVDTDVPSPSDGVLETVLAAEGQTVAVGAAVAVIREDAGAQPSRPAEDDGGHFRAAHAPQLVSFRGQTPGSEARVGGGGRRPGSEAGVGSGGQKPGSEAGVGGEGRRQGSEAGVGGEGRRPRSYSPAVLAAARDGNVPLQTLTTMRGSGRGGRITKADVARLLQNGGVAAGPATASAASNAWAVPPEYQYRPVQDDQVVPMSPVRRTIARHMTWSVRISPHASAFVDCDATRLVEAIRAGKDEYAARVGAPLTYTVVAAAALVAALREFPAFNASVVDDAIVIKRRVHLGIAVALPDTDELVVPVVHDADGLTLDGLARAIHDLASRARERRLRAEDVHGGTFTLTNPGMFGGVTGTPILNQPQVGIVGLGAIIKRAVVLDGDRIAARPMMTVSLTFDHRAADGMAAFKFLDRFRTLLEAGPSR